VQLHDAWYHCRHLCHHPWRVFSVFKPECFPCLLMFEIWVSFICLQPQILIKVISHVFSNNPHIIGIIRTEKRALTFSISILHLPTFLQPSTTIPPLQRT
jgi:hypothetical protein